MTEFHSEGAARAAQTMPGRNEPLLARLYREGYWQAGTTEEQVDAILAEIEQAGYVIVRGERWERVRAVAEVQHRCHTYDDSYTETPWFDLVEERMEITSRLHPDDLDGEAGA